MMFMYAPVPLCVFVHACAHVNAGAGGGLKKGIRSPGAGLSQFGVTQCVCWEVNLDLLKESRALNH